MSTGFHRVEVILLLLTLLLAVLKVNHVIRSASWASVFAPILACDTAAILAELVGLNRRHAILPQLRTAAFYALKLAGTVALSQKLNTPGQGLFVLALLPFFAAILAGLVILTRSMVLSRDRFI